MKRGSSDKETIEELRLQLFEANCIIEAIKAGAIDALVLNKSGTPNIYTLESADFTYRILVEKSGEGALSISSTGLVLYSNERFAQMVDLPVNHIVGSYFNSYIDSVGKFQQLKTALSDGPSKGEIVLNVDGKKLPVYASLTSLMPQLEAIGIIITDLSEKRRHEDALTAYRQKLEAKINELKRMNFNLEQFVHVITHDIKDPIRQIRALTEQFVKEAGDGMSSEHFGKLQLLHNSTLRLNETVSELSTYTLNIHSPVNSQVDLNAVIKDVTEDMSMTIAERKAQVVCKKLPNIKGSAIQMRRLFLNLIGSAIKLAQADTEPRLRISSEIADCVDMRKPNKKYYRIDLQCHRAGIDQKHVARMSEILARPYTAGMPITEELGLVICKRIMENHAGKMEIASDAGEGNFFRLYFPYSAQAEYSAGPVNG